MLEEDVNVKTVDMQKGTGQGPPVRNGLDVWLEPLCEVLS